MRGANNINKQIQFYPWSNVFHTLARVDLFKRSDDYVNLPGAFEGRLNICHLH